MPTVSITGANGLIGLELCRHFLARGWKVRALARRPEGLPVGAEYHPYALAQPISDDVLRGSDYLIHCAMLKHSKANTEASRINVEGTRLLIAQSRKLDLRRFVFLSSFSAHEGAESQYGLHKRQAEELCDPSRDLVLRLALVLGPAGLSGAIAGLIRRFAIVPVIGPRQPVQILALGDVSRIIELALSGGAKGVFSVADPSPYTMGFLVRELARGLGLRGKRVFVPLPITPVLWLVRAAETLGVDLPVSSESFRGLKNYRVQDVKPDLRRLGFEPQSLRAQIDQRLGSS